jgi:zona occludens toxin
MITLLTAVPGAGKTAYAVKMLLEDADLQGRPIFANITGLKLPHFPIDADWIRNWHKNAPPGAFILFDECQDVFPPRHVSKEPPEFVNMLSKHRKDFSVDFFFITQSPSLIDHAVKALVERYLYIRLDGLITMLHESKKVLDFEDKSVRETHAGTPYKLPKHVFDLYKSAEIHTKKPRRKMPAALYVFGFAVALAIGLGVYIYQNRIKPQLNAANVEAEQGGGLPHPARSTMASFPMVPPRIVEALTPTDDHNPLSAPLYAAVVPPVVAPEVVGCIASKSACNCYSQQATPIWLPEEQCRQRAAGLYFDPYRNPVSESQTFRTDAPRSGSEATAPKGLEPIPTGTDPRIPSPPPAGEALT